MTTRAPDSEKRDVADKARAAQLSVIPEGAPTLPNPAPYVAKTKKWALVAVVVASFALAAWVAAPLWTSILLGIVGALSVQRPYRWLADRFGEGRRPWAAAITTLTSGVLMAAVGALVLFTVANELMKLVNHLALHGDSSSLAGVIGERPARAVANLGVDTTKVYDWLHRELAAAAQAMAGFAATVLRTASFAVLGLVVALLTMYYVLIDGPSLARRIERIAPLEPRHTRALLVEAREVGRTAFLGTILTAGIQGVLAGVGYAIFGVPQPVTWAVVTALASLLPMLGTALVWAPVSGWLIVEGHPARGVLLLAWGFIVVTSLTDYVIRPRLIGRRGHGHPLLTLIALFGGIEVFGLAGLIVAPIVMSVFVAAFRLYEREMRVGALPAPHS